MKYVVPIALISALFIQAAYSQKEIKRAMQKFPKVGAYEVLSGDFHIHTMHSDGKPTPAERVQEAWEYGYDVIAITDHGNYKSYNEAKPLADALGMTLIRGLESGMAGKEHLLLLNVPDNYQPLKSHSWDLERGEGKVYYQDELNKLKKMGAVVVYAHPHVGFNEVPNWGVENGIIVGLEVKNLSVGSGWNSINTHGTWCYPNGFKWALEKGIGVFANSDVHATRNNTGGYKSRTVTLLLAKNKSPKAVVDAIKNRRTIAWFDGMLWANESLMTTFMNDVVKAKQSVLDDGTAIVALQNLTPVTYKLTVMPSATGVEPLTLGAYESLLIKRTSAQQSIRIKWNNIYITPDENLINTYDLEI